jgi:hypothetical protein
MNEPLNPALKLRVEARPVRHDWYLTCAENGCPECVRAAKRNGWAPDPTRATNPLPLSHHLKSPAP